MELSFNLGLAAVPELKDSELFPEFVRLYNAIKLTAAMLDNYTGNTPTSEDSDEKRPTQINTFHTFSLPAKEKINLARLVSIYNDSGTSKLKQGSAIFGSNPRIQGIALETKKAGEVCKFLLKGLIKFDDAALVPGSYYRHVGSGYMQSDTEQESYWNYQIIGYAVDEYYLWFDPDIYWSGYVNPNPA